METLAQDYVSACMSLGREGFISALGGPVLVVVKTSGCETFSSASTEMSSGPKKKKKADRPRLTHKQAVVELRRADGLPFDSITIGRTADNDVVLEDETVSSHHARMYYVRTTHEILIEDLHSRNGTAVNGRLILPERALKLSDGDEIIMGDSKFLFFSPEGFYDALRQMIADV